MLPDVPLLEIFDFYVTHAWIEAWRTLVRVCQRWRNLVYGSPRRLKLRLYCGHKTPARKLLDIWPAIPFIIVVYDLKNSCVDDICAALEHNNRIHEIDLNAIPSSQSGKVLAAIHRPFPLLERLQLVFENETAPVDPDLFLGGPARGLKRLKTLSLNGIPASGLPVLLLSATRLVRLELCGIPHSGYISPVATVTCLSVLTRLESLVIEFESPRSRPGRENRHPQPQPRTLLPLLDEFRFKGSSKYFEDFVARVDAPLLRNLAITFFHRLIFVTPQLTQFITRIPQFKTHEDAFIVFSDSAAWISLDGVHELKIICREPALQLLSLVQVCNSSFPRALLPTVGDLYVIPDDGFSNLRWPDDVESSHWLELFRPFTAVEDLHISQEFIPRIAPALRELVGERVVEVLPVLQALFLEDTLPSESGPGIGQFVAARRRASRPISVSCWDRELSDSS